MSVIYGTLKQNNGQQWDIVADLKGRLQRDQPKCYQWYWSRNRQVWSIIDTSILLVSRITWYRPSLIFFIEKSTEQRSSEFRLKSSPALNIKCSQSKCTFFLRYLLRDVRALHWREPSFVFRHIDNVCYFTSSNDA